jgi:septal ring factor EnvC (AmiA/AmiB activator)
MTLPSPKVLAVAAVLCFALAVVAASIALSTRTELERVQTQRQALEAERDHLDGALRRLEKEQAGLESLLAEQNRQLDAITEAVGKSSARARPDGG